ncbi:MAG TPA: PadR family transcriptional regulator [Mycobacterium sp.]
MGLRHAILVSLSEQSGSGYELARRFDRSIGFFWRATHQQIYRTLGAMESDGLVTVTPVRQRGRPDKKVYDVSEAGRAELARWIAEPPTGPGADARVRDLAVKIRGAGFGDVAAVRRHVGALRAERVARRDVYREMEKRQFPRPAGLRGSALHQYLVLRGGIRAEENTIDWLEEVKAAL